MKRALSVLTGAAVGAGVMYFTDPDEGVRRRAAGRDRAGHLLRRRAVALRGLTRHLVNRARGTLATARAACRAGTSDRLLVERIRSRIGHVVSHPHGIDVAVANGRVTLRGHVGGDEVRPLLHAIAAVPGVVDIDHGLTVHPSAGDILPLEPRTAPGGHRGALVAAAALGGAVAGALAAVASRRPTGYRPEAVPFAERPL
jgi:hypothetical protein